jgi:hypothetical protein
LHDHLVTEQPKTVPELYEQFKKFSKSDKATRFCYNDNQHSYPKPMHSINSDGCGPPENWEKNFGSSLQLRN